MNEQLSTAFLKSLVVAEEYLERAEVPHCLLVVRVVFQSVQVGAAGLIVVSVNL